MSTLRRSGFIRLWGSTASANLGDGLLRVLLPLSAVSVQASPFGVALVVACAYLPWLTGSLLVGVVVDRIDRTLLIRTASAVRVAITLGLLVLVAMDGVTVWFLIGFALLNGFAEVTADLSVQSAVAGLIAEGDFEKAYGRVAATQAIANALVGPALGGTLFSADARVAVGLAVLCQLAAGLLVPSIGASAAAGTPWSARQVGRDLRDGVTAVTRNSWLRRAALSVGTMNLASGASAGLLVSYAVRPGPLDLSTRQYGLLLAALGVGSMLGNTAAARLDRALGERRAVAVGVLGLLTAIAAPGLTTNVVVLALLMISGSAVGALFAVKVISMRQRSVPGELLGRVNATFQFAGIGAAPLGALTGGLVASLVGIRPVLLGLAAITTVAVLALRPWSVERPVVVGGGVELAREDPVRG